MKWNDFLAPTIGKSLLTIFFLLVPIPLPAAFQVAFRAKYAPILSFPFLVNSTGMAYLSIILIALEFYLLASLISNVYHRFVLKDMR